MHVPAGPKQSAILSPQDVRRHYRRPPVLEAIIDIQAELPANAHLSALDKVRSAEDNRYPQRDEILEGSFMLQVGPEISSTAAQKPIGYRLVTSERDRIAQIRLNGLSCSKLPPYDSWEQNRDEAKRLWRKYLKAVNPVAVTRLAVRYINRIRLPDGDQDLTEFFRLRPEIPADMPHAVSAFLMRLEIPQPDIPGVTLILSQGTVSDPDTKRHAFLFDLDLIQVVRVPAEGNTIWEMLERLHARENLLFEHCITDRTRALFD